MKREEKWRWLMLEARSQYQKRALSPQDTRTRDKELNRIRVRRWRQLRQANKDLCELAVFLEEITTNQSINFRKCS